MKARIVTEDERETSGARSLLNYGHTIGHALEAVTGYGALLHGEAVALGLLGAARIGQAAGLLDAALVQRHEAIHESDLISRLGCEQPTLDAHPLRVLGSNQATEVRMKNRRDG